PVASPDYNDCPAMAPCDAPSLVTLSGVHRRTFVHAMGASLARGPWAARIVHSARRLNRIGLELFSVRDAMGRDPEPTLAAARRAGIWLAFHNESDHMTPIDGMVPYDVFVARTDPSVVRLQLDVGNMVMGGCDPFAYLQRYRDRYWSFHLKDVVADRSRDTE